MNRSIDAIVADLYREVAGCDVTPGRFATARTQEILPSIYRIGAAATAVVALVGLAYDALARTLGGTGARVTVDGREASLAFRSEAYLRVNGVARQTWAALSGDYAAADGYVRLHGNYPHHARAIGNALGVREHRAAVEAAVAARSALDIETRVLAAGGAAAALRSRDGWLASDAGKAVLETPLVEITQVGEAPPGPPHERPRVLDLTRVISGPLACKVLASLETDVLQIGSRALPELETLAIESGFEKRFAYLDLRAPGDRAAFASLVRGADAVVQSYRPGALEHLGFGAAATAGLRPGIVYTSISAYGSRGPFATRRGFDSLVQLATGLASAASDAYAREAPMPLPAQALDHATGWLAAFGTLVALERRARVGGSWRVDLSLARTAEWLVSLGPSDGQNATAPAFEDDAELITRMASPFGNLTHLVSPLVLDGVRVVARKPPPIPGVPLWQ